MVIHYVRYPYFQERGPAALLYPICRPKTWEYAQGWTSAPLGSVITCLMCIVREHEVWQRSEHQLMVRVDA